MRLRQLTHAITQATRLRIMNAYLVREDDGFTLVDTTASGGATALLRAADSLGAPIRRIVLTHGHLDHAGSLDALREALPDAEVLFGTREARLLAGDATRDAGEADKPIRAMAHPSTRPTRTLEPGDTVGSLQVHAAPGHTPGQIALLDRRDGTLYCGDAYASLGGVATSAHIRPWMPAPAIASWDRDVSLESAVALRALDPTRLAPGHGKVVEAPGAAMDRAVARGA